MRELIDNLKDIKLAIFDLDGVIYRGNSLIPNSDKVINDLKENSIKVVFNSNNSTVTRQMYVDRLKGFNIESEITDFYTSASITAGEITNKGPDKKSVTISAVKSNSLHTAIGLGKNIDKNSREAGQEAASNTVIKTKSATVRHAFMMLSECDRTNNTKSIYLD